MTKDKCAGCDDNFYNGNNPYDIKECWSLKTAKLIMRKRVHVDQIPPWNQKAQKYPNCYRQRGYVFVRPDQIN